MNQLLLVILAALGLWIILWILRSVLSALPIPGVQRGFFERWKLRRSQRMLNEIDALIDSEQYRKAATLFSRCLYLDLVHHDPDLIGRIGAHHLAVLNKTILLSDLMDRPLSDLAILEDLLNTRIQLLRARLDLRRQREIAHQKGAPKWARDEFRKKEAEVLNRLQTNASTILTQFERSLRAVLGRDAEEGITYH